MHYADPTIQFVYVLLQRNIIKSIKIRNIAFLQFQEVLLLFGIFSTNIVFLDFVTEMDFTLNLGFFPFVMFVIFSIFAGLNLW